MNTVQGLLDANFIFEVKYTKWLSNVMLVKKTLGKCKMCVDYKISIEHAQRQYGAQLNSI